MLDAAKAIATIQQQRHYTHARISYRAERYAYVHVHAPGTERQRHYVGTQPSKIAAAISEIERGDKLTLMLAKQAELDAACKRLAERIANNEAETTRVLEQAKGIGLVLGLGAAEQLCFDY